MSLSSPTKKQHSAPVVSFHPSSDGRSLPSVSWSLISTKSKQVKKKNLSLLVLCLLSRYLNCLWICFSLNSESFVLCWRDPEATLFTYSQHCPCREDIQDYPNTQHSGMGSAGPKAAGVGTPEWWEPTEAPWNPGRVGFLFFPQPWSLSVSHIHILQKASFSTWNGSRTCTFHHCLRFV